MNSIHSLLLASHTIQCMPYESIYMKIILLNARGSRVCMIFFLAHLVLLSVWRWAFRMNDARDNNIALILIIGRSRPVDNLMRESRAWHNNNRLLCKRNEKKNPISEMWIAARKHTYAFSSSIRCESMDFDRAQIDFEFNGCFRIDDGQTHEHLVFLQI